MKVPIGLTLVLIVFTLTLSFNLKGSYGYFSNLLLSIGTSLIAGLIFYFAITYVLELKELEKNAKMRRLGFGLLAQPLDNHFEFLLRLANDSGDDKYYTISTAFDAVYFSKIKKFDIEAPACYYPPDKWENIIAERIKAYKSALNSILNTYLSYLNEEDVRLIEQVKFSCDFFLPTGVFDFLRSRSIKKIQPFNQGVLEGFQNHINLSLELLKRYNASVDSEKVITRIQVGTITNGPYS